MGIAQLLPPGMQQFEDGNGVPLSSGLVYMYIPPLTTTFKNTWLDRGEVTLNQNPVPLDSAGRAVIFGEGQYRQVLKDQFGNTVWDKLVEFISQSGTPAQVAVASVAALKALTAPTLVAGSLYYVSGYTTVGDGGQGLFLATTVNPGADNGGTIIWSNTAGFYFLRQFSGELQPNWFGATGNGATDDSAAFQNCLNAVPANGGMYIPAASVAYLCATGLTRTGRISIRGDGIASAINYTGNGIALNLNGPRFSRLQNFAIFGTAAAVGGIYVRSAQQGYFDTSVRVEGFTGAGAYGRRFSSCWTGKIDGGSSHGNTNGLIFDKTLDSVSAINNSFTIQQHDCSNCPGIGIDFQKGFAISILGCDFSTTGTGIELGRGNAGGELCRNITVQGNYFESTNCIYVGRNGTAGVAAYINILGNYLNGSVDCIHIFNADSVAVGPQTMAGANTIDAGVTGTQWGSEQAVVDNSAAGQTSYSQWNVGYLQAKNLATTPTTVAQLGSANPAGQRRFVTDATQTLTAGIGAVVAGGGANAVPVVSGAGVWRIG